MSGKRSVLFSVGAALVVLGPGIIGAGPASALGQRPAAIANATVAAGHSGSATAVGIYDYTDGGIITEGGAATTLTINANGTFALTYASITDNGVWIQDGKTVALTVTAGEDGSAGCLLLGTVKRKGINSAAAPGPIDCMVPFGKSGTWYAAVPRHVR